MFNFGSSQTTYKILLGVGLTLGIGLSQFALNSTENSHRSIAVMIIGIFFVLLVPYFVFIYLFADILAGGKFINLKNFEKSKQHSLRFIAKAQKFPWITRISGILKPPAPKNLEAAAYNNLGVAQINLRDFQGAKKSLELGVAIEPNSPLLNQNLGLVNTYLAKMANV